MDLKLKLLNTIVFALFIGGTLPWICFFVSSIIYHCIWKTPDHRKSKFQKLSLDNNPRDCIKFEINSLQNIVVTMIVVIRVNEMEGFGKHC